MFENIRIVVAPFHRGLFTICSLCQCASVPVSQCAMASDPRNHPQLHSSDSTLDDKVTEFCSLTLVLVLVLVPLIHSFACSLRASSLTPRTPANY